MNKNNVESDSSFLVWNKQTKFTMDRAKYKYTCIIYVYINEDIGEAI